MPPHPIGAAARALAHQECEAIDHALESASGQHASVHAARKAVRRLRSLLALFERSDLDLEDADRRLRRLGDGLSRLRDAHVLVEAVTELARQAPALPWTPVLQALQDRRELQMQRACAGDPGFQRRRQALQRVARDLEAQPWQALRKAELRAGVARSERRTLKAAARARHSTDPELLHRWRRRVRRLRMQLDALPHLDNALADTHRGQGSARQARALHRLGDRIGRDQDLLLLRRRLRAMRGIDGKPALLAQIDAQRAASSARPEL